MFWGLGWGRRFRISGGEVSNFEGLGFEGLRVYVFGFQVYGVGVLSINRPYGKGAGGVARINPAGPSSCALMAPEGARL